jgi:hypothetical protein
MTQRKPASVLSGTAAEHVVNELIEQWIYRCPRGLSAGERSELLVEGRAESRKMADEIGRLTSQAHAMSLPELEGLLLLIEDRATLDTLLALTERDHALEELEKMFDEKPPAGA